MEDPEFRQEYALADQEYALVAQLVRARTEANLTQAEVAQRLGTTQSVIARLEGGRVSPSIATVRRYAEATGTRLTVGLQRVGGEGMPRSAGCPPALVVTVLTGRLRGLVDVFAELGADPTGGLANLERSPRGGPTIKLRERAIPALKWDKLRVTNNFCAKKPHSSANNRRETEEALTELAQPVRTVHGETDARTLPRRHPSGGSRSWHPHVRERDRGSPSPKDAAADAAGPHRRNGQELAACSRGYRSRDALSGASEHHPEGLGQYRSPPGPRPSRGPPSGVRNRRVDSKIRGPAASAARARRLPAGLPRRLPPRQTLSVVGRPGTSCTASAAHRCRASPPAHTRARYAPG